MRTLLALFVLLGSVAGCALVDSTPSGPQACTLEFRTYAVRVVDADGQPVTGLQTTVRNERTGEVLTFDDTGTLPADGTYLVATDAHTVSRSGDRLTFRAEGEGLVATAEYAFYFDGCHVLKRSGPEEIVARPA